MRWMYQGLLFGSVSLLLAGCGFNPLGADIPKPVTVAGYLDETTTGSVKATGESLTAGEYLVASISYTNEKCHEFFNDLAKVKEDSQLLDKILTSAVATGSPILALTETAGTVGTTTSIINAVNGVNNDAATILFFADVKDELEGLIFREMSDVLRDKNLDQLADAVTGLNIIRRKDLDIDVPRAREFFRSSDPLNLMIARNIATDYAAKCTLSNMRGAIPRSIAKNNGAQAGDGTITPSTGTTDNQTAEAEAKATAVQ